MAIMIARGEALRKSLSARWQVGNSGLRVIYPKRRAYSGLSTPQVTQIWTTPTLDLKSTEEDLKYDLWQKSRLPSDRKTTCQPTNEYAQPML